MGLLDGKIALITGAGAGIGRGVARAFVREGAKVMIAELNEANAKKTAEDIRKDFGGEVDFIQTDVSNKAACVAAIDATAWKFGGLDVLVNNASKLTPNILLEDKTDEMLAQTLGVGLWGTWWMMREALPHMQKRGGGRIINFYSIDADAAAWLHGDYNATKGAIQSLTRSAAAEWGRFNILVNAIAPAAAGTVFEELCREFPGYAEAAGQYNPLGRVGDPETDIAPVLVFLASEMSRYVTGETINVDGGQHLPRYNSKPADLEKK